jgi:ABC-type transport system substrate-binding protein
MLGWATLPMLDGFSVLSAMLATTEGSYGTFTPAGYSNAKVDELTKAIAVEMDEPSAGHDERGADAGQGRYRLAAGAPAAAVLGRA